MRELMRRVRSIRCEATDPGHVFAHRVRIGILVAALILILSIRG